MTPEQVELLAAPFATNEHEFLKGKIYITESAITRRMDEVDPGWSFVIRLTEHRGEKTVIYAALTVAGVTRESNGMGESNYGKDKPRLPENEVNEREKSALTDALKRCARLFGIGRYMLDMGDSVSDPKTLDRWLKARYAPEAKRALSDDEARKFVAHWKNVENLSYKEVLTALDVADVRDWNDGLANAHARVALWCKENPAEPVENEDVPA